MKIKFIKLWASRTGKSRTCKQGRRLSLQFGCGLFGWERFVGCYGGLIKERITNPKITTVEIANPVKQRPPFAHLMKGKSG